MPVPSSISDLSTTPALNSPPGSESPSSIDDYLRTHAAFIKQISDASVQTSGNQTVAGTKTFSASPVAPNPTAGTRSQALATMQMFADEFGSSLSANGYQKLPSGLIIQWGSVTTGAANVASIVTLPIAFPNSLLINPFATGALASGLVYTNNAGNNTQITISSTTASNSVSWLAIGE